MVRAIKRMEQSASALLTLNGTNAAFLCAKLSETGSKNAVLCKCRVCLCQVCVRLHVWVGKREIEVY